MGRFRAVAEIVEVTEANTHWQPRESAWGLEREGRAFPRLSARFHVLLHVAKLNDVWQPMLSDYRTRDYGLATTSSSFTFRRLLAEAATVLEVLKVTSSKPL